MIDMKNPAVAQMVRWINQQPSGQSITMVTIDRYQDRSRTGIHLLMQPAHDDRSWKHITLGLFSQGDAEALMEAFSEGYVVTANVGPFPVQYEPHKAYIRSRVIPLEWKGYSDVQLTPLVGMAHGRVRYVDNDGRLYSSTPLDVV